MPELLPLDQWYEPIAGTEVRMREPTGEPYDPNGIPAWLGRTGLNYVRSNTHKIRLTCLFSMQNTADNLGAPGEFEALMETATLLGDDISPSTQQNLSYRERCIAAVRNKAVTGFHVGHPSNPHTYDVVREIRLMALNHKRGDMFEDIRLLDPETFIQKVTTRRISAAMLLHVEQWSILQNVDEFAESNPGKHHAVLCLKPFGLDIVRKAQQVLGLTVGVRRIDEENWPIDYVSDTFNASAILSTGKFDTASLRQR